VRQELLAGMSIVKKLLVIKKVAGPGLIFCGGGTLMGKVQDVMHDWNNTRHSNMFNPLDETEVTNFMYLEYLDWLKNVFHK
jgi:hypothetical protein